jgi:hypothetical protein
MHDSFLIVDVECHEARCRQCRAPRPAIRADSSGPRARLPCVLVPPVVLVTVTTCDGQYQNSRSDFSMAVSRAGRRRPGMPITGVDAAHQPESLV